MANRIQMKRAGARELLHSPGVIDDLTSRMQAVARAFGEPLTIEVSVTPAGRAVVRGTDTRVDALFRESWTGDLAASMVAAAGSRERVGANWGPRRQWGPGLRFPRRGTEVSG
ncbi:MULTISPECIES: hypothetical protein [unclassified Microbacterium]|uniref:hypothetical protein n=1 Tax=unclassified Microbacterium TaxID=2609290 RepID=UPI003865CCEC